MSPAAQDVPALHLDGVTKRFGRGQRAVVALSDVSFDVGANERVVVLGATGAGKTTLLRVIAGLETPDGGRLALAGRDAAPLEPAQRDVALVFQNFSLYPHLSVRDNLAFPLRAPGRALATSEVTKRVDEAAALLRITRLLDRPAKNLSGGEMQRVAIGRAIVRRPRLFLLDEPLTNLDAKLRESLRLELVKLFRELAVPVVYVTHDQAEALSMADRIVVLAHGRVLQSGTPREIYLAPATPAVARQLGQPTINLIDVERRGAAWCALDGTPLLRADAEAARGAGGATRALLGVRPEQGRLHASATPGTFAGRVELVEECGPHRIVAVHALGQTLRFAVANDRSFAPGAPLQIELPPEQLLLWPADPSAR